MTTSATTKYLTVLHREYGLLYVTLQTIEEARAQWADALGPVMSQDELDAIPIAEDEPVLVVKMANVEEPHFLKPDQHPVDHPEIPDARRVSVLGLPPDEFHFFSTFRPGVSDLTQGLPGFVFKMALVYAHSVLEHFLTSLLRAVLVRRPEMLGATKQVSYRDVLESPSKESLVEHMIEKAIKDFAYQSFRDQLRALRSRFGYCDLGNELDDPLVELSLLRNCLVHNAGIVDEKLARASAGVHVVGTPAIMDSTCIGKAITTFRQFASQVDRITLQVHLRDSASGSRRE